MDDNKKRTSLSKAQEKIRQQCGARANKSDDREKEKDAEARAIRSAVTRPPVQTPDQQLFQYAASGNVPRMVDAIEQGANRNGVNSGGFTPLHVAAQAGEEIAVQYLLNIGVAVNARTPDGETALNLAIRNQNIAVVDLLLTYGGDLIQTNARGQTALHHAMNTSKQDIACRVIESGPALDIVDPVTQCTPLMTAAQKKWEATLDILLAAGADPGVRNIAGRNAFDGLSAESDIYKKLDAAAQKILKKNAAAAHNQSHSGLGQNLRLPKRRRP